MDEGRCATAKPHAAHALGIIDASLAEHDFLVGEDISLADFFLLPILYYFRQLPEGIEIRPTLLHLGAWCRPMGNRPSVIITTPPSPGER